MRVTIVEIVGKAGAPCVVRVSCSVGCMEGVWRGPGLPACGDERYVELETNSDFTMGQNLIVSQDACCSATFSEGVTTLCGQLSQVFENHTAALELADAQVLFDYRGELPPLGTWMTLAVADLRLYDINL